MLLQTPLRPPQLAQSGRPGNIFVVEFWVRVNSGFRVKVWDREVPCLEMHFRLMRRISELNVFSMVVLLEIISSKWNMASKRHSLDVDRVEVHRQILSRCQQKLVRQYWTIPQSQPDKNETIF